MDSDVDPAGEQRLFDLLDENAAGADLAEGLRTVTVANGRDGNESDVQVGIRPPQSLRGELRLDQGEPTSP